MKATLSVDLGGVVLPTPVMVAAGCFGPAREVAGLVDMGKVGGAVTRTITLEPRSGSPGPRMAETPSGVLTHIGLQNPGVDRFLEIDLPRLVRPGLPLFVSIAGSSLEEYVRMTTRLHGAEGVSGIEVYLGAFDEELGAASFTVRVDRAAEIVGAVARMSMFPVFAKLPAFAPDLAELARACVRVGAHGLTLVDGIPALGVDLAAMRPALGATDGYLSGPAVRPIALRAVFDVAQALPDVPILGVGGVATGDDAVEMLLAGAWAVQVGTASLIDPAAPVEIARGVGRYLRSTGAGSPADVRGRLRTGLARAGGAP